MFCSECVMFVVYCVVYETIVVFLLYLCDVYSVFCCQCDCVSFQHVGLRLTDKSHVTTITPHTA